MRAVRLGGAARDASKPAIKSAREDDPILDDVGGRAGWEPSPSASRLSAFPRRRSGQVGTAYDDRSVPLANDAFH